MPQSINQTMSRRVSRAGLVSGLLALTLGMMAPAPAPAASDNGAPKWKVWTYNASGRAFKGSVPAKAAPNAVATFPFPLTPDVALLITDHGSYKGTLLGDLTNKMISATVSVSGGPFTYYGQPDACGAPATVRFYFQTKSPASFIETDYWWSNPVAVQLSASAGQVTMSASFNNPGGWSDYNGKSGGEAAYTAAFYAAVKDVTSIGLSFGGGCFFENGVGAPTGGSFTLHSFGATP